MLSDRRSRNDDDGVALIGALFAVVVLTGLAVLFAATAFSQNRASGSERRFENALHMSESATDEAILNVNDDFEYTTTYDGATPHVYLEHDGVTYTDEETWARAVADSAMQTDILVSGDGEAVGIRPVDPTGDPVNLVFGVSYIPDRATVISGGVGKSRVLKLLIQPAVFSPQAAFYIDGDLTIGGGAQTSGLTGNVHVNGDVFVAGNAGDCDTGGFCVRGSLDVVGQVYPEGSTTPMTDSKQDEIDNEHVCPSGQTVPCGADDISEGVSPRTIRPFNAMAFWDPTRPLNSFSDPDTGNVQEARWWVLCRGGDVYAPEYDGAGDARTPKDTCTGPVTSPVWSVGDTNNFHGWTYGDQNCGSVPKPCWAGSKITSGAYYVYDTNATTTGGKGAVTILIGCAGDDPDPSADNCAGNTGDGSRNGSYYMGGQPMFTPALSGAHFVADRDLVLAGQSGTDIDGFIGAREQINVSGNGSMNGSITALDRPHTTNSPVLENEAKGNFTVTYNERLLVPISGVTQILQWTEL